MNEESRAGMPVGTKSEFNNDMRVNESQNCGRQRVIRRDTGSDKVAISPKQLVHFRSIRLHIPPEWLEYLGFLVRAFAVLDKELAYHTLNR